MCKRADECLTQTNFAQVYTTFWDHALGSIYNGNDLEVRYRQGREAADRWVERQKDNESS